MKSRTGLVRVILALIFIATVAQLGLRPVRAAGTISITTLATALTENFDTLANTGTTNTTVPNGWEFSEAGTNANTTYAADTGSLNSGNTYSYGAAASTERAFGGLQSGSLIPTVGASYTNNTGQTITQLAISYTGEQWRSGLAARNAADRLDFQLSTDATSLTTGTWVNYDNLDFNSPNINVVAAGPLDGNAAGNNAAVSFTINGLNIANGAVFWIRWTDFNIASSDDGLSIDDFSLTADAPPEPTNPSGVGAANPNVALTGSNVLLTVTVTPGTNPASTGLAVSADLTTIGGSATQAFLDDGLNGDVAAGDNIFSFLATVPGATPTGAKSLPVSISDAETRTGNTTIDFDVATAAALVINEIDYDQPLTDTAEYIEIRNNDIVAVDLDLYNIQLINGNAGGSAQYQLFDLPAASLAAGDYFVLCANAATVANCDLDVTPETNLIQNGDPDAVALRLGTTVVDAVSYGGSVPAPYTEGSGVGLDDPSATGDDFLSLSRFPDGADTQVNNVDLSVRCSTPGVANVADTTDCVPDTAPTVTATTPINNATDFPINGNLIITFNEPVDVTGTWFTLQCTVSGSVATTVSGGSTIFTLNPDTDLTAGEDCTLTIIAANVTDQDTEDPPNNMAADVVVNFSPITPIDYCSLTFTPIHDIQGNGAATPIPGAVTTKGVVVGDFEGPSPTLRGFYLQSENANFDADPATSEGIFVFNSSFDNVNIGDLVYVAGTAAEFQDQTQIGDVTNVTVCSTGNPATPVDISFPVPSADYLERFEGMLVRIPQAMVVTEHFQLGRFGQVVMSGTARLQQPTNVVLPGAPALALQAANNLNKIIVDDALNSQNPDPLLFGRDGNPLSASNTLRGGDTATGMVGVLTYTWAGNSASGNAFRLRPLGALGGSIPDFQAVNLRPANAPAPAGDVRITGMNLLNYYNTFTGCTYGVGGSVEDCRGADNQIEFDRQWPKTVEAIVGSQADVIGIMEIENDGYGLTSAIQDLVDRLNTATAAGTYTFIDADAATAQVNSLGTDGIKVGIIYNTTTVTPVGTTAVLNTVAFVNGGDPAPRNRPALAQAFEDSDTGEQFVVVANHLKSKGSACTAADAGDGQGNCNAVRLAAVNEMLTWLGSDPTATGDPDILILGDLNSYAMEDPIIALQNAGYTNLISSFNGPDAYSYVFNGQWGYLDHALGTASLTAQVSSVTEWHINADEPSVLDYNTDFKSAGQIISFYEDDEFRMSDHDPVLVDLTFPETAIGYCPVDDMGVAMQRTNVLGIGQTGRTRKLVIPDHEDLVSLYGQLAAVDVGLMKYVRFLPQGSPKIEIAAPTSPAYRKHAVSWWGSEIPAAQSVKGQFFWGKQGNKAPRAFVLWPTYATTDPYADVLALFDVSSENHVAWEPDFIPTQTQIIDIPETQVDGADIVVKVALVDVNKDVRPVILTVTVGGTSQTFVINKPNKNPMLNLEEIAFSNVPAGTNQVEIKLESPVPSATYPAGGDSAAMIGAAVTYACALPEPTR